MYVLFRAIYRKIENCMPESAKEWLIRRMDGVFRRRSRNYLLSHYTNQPHLSEEEKAVIGYLRNNKLGFLPYDWIKEYDQSKVAVQRDADGNYYVEYDRKRLYYNQCRKLMARRQIQWKVNQLLMEMDLRSPHRYVTHENQLFGTLKRISPERDDGFYVEKGDVVADVGCAEGNFALSIIDIASHVYLFECDPGWLRDLERTFKDYKHKVTIVNRYVSDQDSAETVTLDTYFKDRPVQFIKADIEGAEYAMLRGGEHLFAERLDLKAAICTYHKAEDADKFRSFFEEMGYQTSFTDGVMIGSPPAPFRKGVIRAKK